MSRSALVLGVGNSRKQTIRLLQADSLMLNAGPTFDDNFEIVHTLDIDPKVNPTWVHNLEYFPWPSEKDFYDEVHAYECLEHLGDMGNYPFFFRLWAEIWRSLKPGGIVCASAPWWESVWAWQDPGHKRVYSPQLLTYLDQDEYVSQIGRTAMTDYRELWAPPLSFKCHIAGMSGEDPKSAGFDFILEKRVWRPN